MIIRVEKNPSNPYVQMDKRPLEDKNLSFRAKGVLAYLLSRPNNWQANVKDLIQQAVDGETSVRSALKELRRHGYASLHTIRKSDGRVAGKQWLIRELPVTDMQDDLNSVFPKFGQTATNNNDDTSYLNNKESRGRARVARQPPRGASFGIIEEEILEENHSHIMCREFLAFAEKKRLLIGRPRPNLHKWRKECDILIESLEGDVERIRNVLRWYFKNFRSPYLPTCIALTTFCVKFLNIEKAMLRAQGDDRPRSEPRIQVNRRKVSERDFQTRLDKLDS